MIAYQPGALHVRVRDDGRGIDQGSAEGGYRTGHWGLAGMRERADKMRGELRLRSSSEGGTLIDLQVPANVVFTVPRAAKVRGRGVSFVVRVPGKGDFAADSGNGHIPMKKALVAGALGVSGRALVDHTDAFGEWEVIGLSQRQPDFETPGSLYRNRSVRSLLLWTHA